MVNYLAVAAIGLMLLWLVPDSVVRWQRLVASCFLILVALAGLAGAVSAARRILFVQTVPSLIALALVWLG